MNNVQMFWSLCAECIEFLTQMRRGDVLMESRHGEGQTDKTDTRFDLTVILQGAVSMLSAQATYPSQLCM